MPRGFLLDGWDPRKDKRYDTKLPAKPSKSAKTPLGMLLTGSKRVVLRLFWKQKRILRRSSNTARAGKITRRSALTKRITTHHRVSQCFCINGTNCHGAFGDTGWPFSPIIILWPDSRCCFLSRHRSSNHVVVCERQKHGRQVALRDHRHDPRKLCLGLQQPGDAGDPAEHVSIHRWLPGGRTSTGDYCCLAARAKRDSRTGMGSESYFSADDDSLAAVGHCLDSAIGSAHRMDQRCFAQCAAAERGRGTLGYLFAWRHVFRAGIAARAFRLLDDRGVVSRHGPVP